MITTSTSAPAPNALNELKAFVYTSIQKINEQMHGIVECLKKLSKDVKDLNQDFSYTEENAPTPKSS